MTNDGGGDRRPVVAEHAVLVEPGRVETVALTLPPLPAGWVRIRFAYCGVCGTDVNHFEGRRPVAHPLSLGHEWVAVVEVVGDEVPGLAVGDVVTSDLNHRCGRCDACRRGRSHLCDDGDVGDFTNRGFADRADIHHGYLYRCSGRVRPALALAEPLSCALHGLRWSDPGVEEEVLLLGAGGLGACVAFLLATADPPHPFTVADPNETRLRRLVDVVGGLARTDGSDGFDVVIDASGTVSGLRDACRQVRPGGRVCVLSHPPAGEPVPFLLDTLIPKEVDLRISLRNGERENMTEAIRLIEERWDRRWDALLDVRPLEELPEVLAERLRSGATKTVLATDVRSTSG